ncbi:Thioredoxin domain-containing protein C13F5.05, mitochondrial [Hypsizygus marmoreus]|uniref:Thioredoxin domain-containing protein C13F5.05, mitochondrial n=1 Tax=Hypsizygus marmoreus TaxID=39966 RepID=A0A369JGF2_HYPMA|nr:Thioredoxin domain-containing protein C13F5.05, mitochondrial [Hypsizygus marmoreus]
MLSPPVHIVALALALAPSLASAAIFPRDTLVKMLDAKGFRQAMKANQTSMVAFVAPWCGHCQRMAPEYSKAALGLHPLLPVYAVDCDANENKRLCAEQGVKGFPTVKLFPRGNQLGSMTYDSGERTASGFFYWASRRIPNAVTKLYKVEEIKPWVEKTVSKNRVLLLTKDKKVPLLWKVLGNKYKDQLELGTHRDRKGKSSVVLGLEAGEKKAAKVLVYPAGSTKFVRYEGINKLDSLSKFFDSVIDGTADLTIINEEAKAEEFVPDEKELEIERKQEAQRIALAHGGFADLIDFEKLVKEGAGADYHDVHGYPGMMGSPPPPKKAEEKKVEVPVAQQVVFEQEKQVAPPSAGKCSLAEDGPGAEPPMECEPPSVENVVEEKKPVVVGGTTCGPAEEGPGAEPPMECDPPSVEMPSNGHPKDEL